MSDEPKEMLGYDPPIGVGKTFAEAQEAATPRVVRCKCGGFLRYPRRDDGRFGCSRCEATYNDSEAQALAKSSPVD